MLGQFPDDLHDLHKHVVSINGCTNSGVIVVPFLRCEALTYRLADPTIAILVAEVFEEVDNDLFLGHLAGNDMRVQFRVVDRSRDGTAQYLMSAMSM